MLPSGGLASHGNAKQSPAHGLAASRASPPEGAAACAWWQYRHTSESCLLVAATLSSLAVHAVDSSRKAGAWLVSSRHGAAHAVATVGRPVYDLLR